MHFISTGQVSLKVKGKVDVIKVLRELEEKCCKLECTKGIYLRVVMEKREEYWKKVSNNDLLILSGTCLVLMCEPSKCNICILIYSCITYDSSGASAREARQRSTMGKKNW